MNRVAILHCPEHGFYAISINDIRVLGGKCCGRWNVLQSYAVQDAKEIINLLKTRPRIKQGPKLLPGRK